MVRSPARSDSTLPTPPMRSMSQGRLGSAPPLQGARLGSSWGGESSAWRRVGKGEEGPHLGLGGVLSVMCIWNHCRKGIQGRLGGRTFRTAGRTWESKAREAVDLPPALVEAGGWTKWPGEEGLVLSLYLPAPCCHH